MCQNSVLPILFPFFVFSNLWSELGFVQELSKRMERITQSLFHLPGCCSTAILLGSIGGYPVGAQTVSRLYQKALISKEQAERCLMFCNNAGPAFILGIIGAGLFQNVMLGAVLFLIHLSSAMLIGFQSRTEPVKYANHPVESEVPADQSLFTSITNSIYKAGETTIRVCVFILFFSIVSEYLLFVLPEKYLQIPIITVLLGSIELTNGINLLRSFQFAGPVAFTAAAIITSWGGLCVHCQTLSILSESKLSSRLYLLGKCLQSFISGVMAYMLSPILFPKDFDLTGDHLIAYILIILGAYLLFCISRKFLWKKLHKSYIIRP